MYPADHANVECARVMHARRTRKIVASGVHLMHECHNALLLLSSERLFSQRSPLTIWLTCRECGAGEGQMDELIGRLVAMIGVDRTAAEKAVGIILRLPA